MTSCCCVHSALYNSLITYAQMPEFVGLLVQFCSSNSGEEKCSSHTIYCKKHTVRREDPATPSLCTLITLGWPPYVSGSEVEAVFSRVGCVTASYLQHHAGPVLGKCAVLHEGGGGGGMVAYVVFSQPEEVDRALQMCASGDVVRCDVTRTGMRRWCEVYASTRPAVAHLDSAAADIVGHYDRAAAEQQQTRKRCSQPDSEGWVTVPRKKSSLITGHSQTQRKRKAKKVVNFYRFQQRESQREAVAELRRKFLKDKERVAELRAHRKFRPF